MTTASTTVGVYTLTAIKQPSGSIGYSLSTPDGTAYVGSGSLTVTVKSNIPLDSTGKQLTGYRYYNVGSESFLLTEQQGATLIAALPQMVSTVNAELAAEEKTVPAPAPEPTVTKVTSTSTSTSVTSTSNSTATSTPTGTKVSSPEVTTDPSQPVSANTLTKADLAKPEVVTDINEPTLPKIDQPDNAPSAAGASKGLSSAQQKAQNTAPIQDAANEAAKQGDWRVRLSLAPRAGYLYNATDAGILKPLAATDGVIFPYTPSITVSYNASYDPTALTHTNYKVFQYQNSGIDQVQINGDFTAQDVTEANYLLAVIHFFRSMTKMFYGQDSDPKNGTPPPLCFIYGMGGYQFSNLPLAISGFNYSLPTDVDYIATTSTQPAGTPQATPNNVTPKEVSANRKASLGLNTNNQPITPQFTSKPETTWVPTKIQLSITCVPIISRNNVSNNFSLKDYAQGKLLLGSTNSTGGFW